MTDAPCTISKLDDRGVLRVRGADAKSFLQGIVTNDLEQVGPGRAVHSGLLTPQGKILFDFFIVTDQADYLLECPMDNLDDLAKRLTFYKLRRRSRNRKRQLKACRDGDLGRRANRAR